MNTIYAGISVALMLIGSGNYFVLVLQRKIKPHFFTFLIWTVVTFIVLAGLVSEHAGPAIWRTALLAVLLAIGTAVSFRNGLGYVSRFDIISLMLSVLAIPVWIVTNNPDASIIWVLIVEVIGTLPAIRKAWRLPFEEGIFGMSFSALSFFFSFLAMTNPSTAVAIYFLVWPFILILLSAITAYRRTVVARAISSPQI